MHPDAFAKAVLGTMRGRIASVPIQVFACDMLPWPFQRGQRALMLALVEQRCWIHIFNAIRALPCEEVCSSAVVALRLMAKSDPELIFLLAADGGEDAVRMALSASEVVYVDSDASSDAGSEYGSPKASGSFSGEWKRDAEWLLRQFKSNIESSSSEPEEWNFADDSDSDESSGESRALSDTDTDFGSE